MRRIDRFRSALTTGREGDVQRFLESYPRPLHVLFNKGWNGYFALPQFQFGPDYRADFVILSAHSGAWNASFVELEPPTARLYLRDGTESRILRTALRQVKDWARWIDRDRSNLVDALRRGVRIARAKGMKVDAGTSGGPSLFDPDTVVLTEYAIVIGRADTLSTEENSRRVNEQHWSQRVEIVTYDRIVQVLDRDLQAKQDIRNARLR